MASHKHNPSTARSTVKNHNQCHSSVPLSSGAQSSPTGLIPSWLKHVQASVMSNDTSQEIFRQASPGPGETLWHPNGIPTLHIQSNYDAGRYRASDVLIQDTPSPPSLAGQTSRPLVHDPYLNDDHDRDVHERKGHSHSQTHVSTPPGPSRAEYGIFEKQPRRKTRKDRYDTVKQRGARTEKQQAKKSSTRVSKTKRLRSSREIMANFTSSAIAHPDERITTRFKPGLFVNGRSSVPLTDLVFNDIPSPDQGRTPTDKEQWETPRERQSKAQESPNTRDRRATSTTSSSHLRPIRRPVSPDPINGEAVAGRANTIVCDRDDDSSGAKDRAGNNNNRPPPQPDSFTLHIRPIYSLSPSTDPYISDLNTLNMPFSLNGHSIQDAQRESAARHQERNDGGNGDSNQVKATKYRDIGVMVSPQMHQRERHKSSHEDDGDHRLWAGEGVCSYLRTEVGDIHCPPSDSSAAWVYGPHSTAHPFLPFTNNGLSSIDGSESFKTLPTESGDAYNIDLPAQPTISDHAFQSPREACQDANTLYSDTLHVIDDIPGESLMEYIERKEREILSPDELPISYVDNSFLSAQDASQSYNSRVSHMDVFNEARCSSPRRPVQQPIREERHSPFHQYQRLPSPGEILNREIESELTSFWQPNHRMWR